MALIIKNIKVTWNWSGDTYALQGFNVAITPKNENPHTRIVVESSKIDPTATSFIFNSVTLDNALEYTAWVQAIYEGGDSDWVSQGNIIVSDDGSATVSSKKDFDGLATRVSTAESTITVNSDNISLVVKKNEEGKDVVDGYSLISAINIEPEDIKIESKNIDFTGVVSFSSLSDDLSSNFVRSGQKTFINGETIYTKSVKADSVDALGLTVQTEIDGVLQTTFQVAKDGEDAGKVSIKGDVQSFDYKQGESGWRINPEGTAEFNNTVVRGNVLLPSAGMTNFADQNQVVGRNLLKDSSLEKTGSNEYLLYDDLTNIFDIYGVGKYTISFDIKAEKAGAINVYTSDTIDANRKYNFATNKIDVTTEYNRITLNINVTLLTPTANRTSLAFFGTYGTGVIPSVKNVKVEMGTVRSSDYSPAPEDYPNPVRIWAGSNYDDRDNAPFQVLEDGTVKATKGIFGGTFTGNLQIGNINISDTDPNTDGASISISTDGNERTLVQFRESGGFIDTQFIFGNVDNKYIEINNENNVFSVNNNALRVSQFSNNLLLNSAWVNNTNGWTLNSGVSRDTSDAYSFNGYPTIKSIQSGRATNVWYGMQSSYTDANEGDAFTFSIYSMSTNIAGIDAGCAMEIRYWDSTNTRITQSSASIKPTANNEWQYFTLTGVCPANTVRITVIAYVTKNGSLWFANPQLEAGITATTWGVHESEIKEVTMPNRVDRNYIEFNDNKFNIDVKNDTLYIQSNTNSDKDFIFTKDSSNESVYMLVDGDLEFSNSIKAGKLTIVRKNDTGNSGIDFIFM